MEQETIQNNSKDQEFLEKIGAGEHNQYPSFDLGDHDYRGISVNRCNNCNSERLEILVYATGRRIRCHECGHEE